MEESEENSIPVLNGKEDTSNVLDSNIQQKSTLFKINQNVSNGESENLNMNDVRASLEGATEQNNDMCQSGMLHITDTYSKKGLHTLPTETVIDESKHEKALEKSKFCEDKPSVVRSSSDSENNSHLQNSRSYSEYDLRAATMRAKIEQKLDEIVREMNSESQTSINSEMYDNDPDSFPDVTERIQLLQARRCRSYSLAEMKDIAIARLQLELDNAQKVLKLKDEEVTRLSKIRDEVGAEIEDLTASLFEEANNMVRESNVKQAIAEKRAKEANMKLSMLQDEVVALKTLVQATVPYAPSYIPSTEPQNTQVPTKKPFFKRSTYQKSPSCNDLQAKARNEMQQPPTTNVRHVTSSGVSKELYEPDPILHQEFVSWRQNPSLEKSHPFLQRIYLEDIYPCMSFENKVLSEKVMAAIEANAITVESVSGKSPLPKKCALLEAPRFCRYRVNLGDSEDYYYISTLSRNRIAAICDLFCYLRYIVNGLVKHSIREVFLEILKKRKAIFVARIGLIESDSS